MSKRILAAVLAVFMMLGCAIAEQAEPVETAAAAETVDGATSNGEPVVIGIYTEGTAEEEITYDVTEYVNDEGGYVISLPADWEFADVAMPGGAEGASAVKTFLAMVSPEADKSLSIITADAGSMGIEDLSSDVDKLTDEVIGRLKNVTAADNNGIVTSGSNVYMYIGYIVDGSTIDQYYRVVGSDLVMVTFVNESDNGFKGAVLSTLNGIEG